MPFYEKIQQILSMNTFYIQRWDSCGPFTDMFNSNHSMD